MTLARFHSATYFCKYRQIIYNLQKKESSETFQMTHNTFTVKKLSLVGMLHRGSLCDIRSGVLGQQYIPCHWPCHSTTPRPRVRHRPTYRYADGKQPYGSSPRHRPPCHTSQRFSYSGYNRQPKTYQQSADRGYMPRAQCRRATP